MMRKTEVNDKQETKTFKEKSGKKNIVNHCRNEFLATRCFHKGTNKDIVCRKRAKVITGTQRKFVLLIM